MGGICITEEHSRVDMMKVSAHLKTPSRLIGPNCPGVITPNACKIGIMPGPHPQTWLGGVVSRSGTLTYEAVKQTSDSGVGSPLL
jgi:succinyl-CoA synthetase alpha subunit